VRPDRAGCVGIPPDRLGRFRGEDADAQTGTDDAEADGEAGGETLEIHACCLFPFCGFFFFALRAFRPRSVLDAVRDWRRDRCPSDSPPREIRRATRSRARST